MATRIDIPNILINFLKKARYERLVREQEVDPNQLYATTDGNEKTEYGDLFGNIENQTDLYNALYSSRIFTKAMCDDPRGYAIVKALRESAKYFDINKFTVIGSPTITEEGIASGFSNSDYITMLPLSVFKNKSWTVECKTLLTYSNNCWCWPWKCSEGWNAWGSIGVFIASGNLQVCLYTRTGVSEDANNEGIRVSKGYAGIPSEYIKTKLVFDLDTGTYTLYADIGEGYELIGSHVATTTNPQLYYIDTAPNALMCVGCGTDNQPMKFDIDLKSYIFTINGETIFRGYSEHTGTDTYPLYNITIPYVESRDGVKIVDVQYKDLVDQLYDLTGQGNYIIIDEANEEFRLPLPDLYSQLENKSSFILRKWED